MASALFNDLLQYYQSFAHIFYHQTQPKSKLDLFHWSFYLFFVLWNEQVTSNGHTAKYLFHMELEYESKMQIPIKYIIFSRWIMLIALLSLPIIFILLALFKDPIYFTLITNPDFIEYIGCIDAVKSCNKHQILTHWPISMAYNMYAYYMTKNDHLCIMNKHLFHEFCEKYGIPTIKCIHSANELKETKKTTKEYIIKETRSHAGQGTICTMNPEEYLNKIPDVVIQPRLRNHESIINISKNKKTLCTFRISTYNTDLKLKTESYLKTVSNEECITDNQGRNYGEASWDQLVYENGIFRKWLIETDPMLIVSKDKSDSFECKIEGLNEFIQYLERLHHKYLNDLPGIGWDAAKITNGSWIIVECNTWTAYYYSNKNYSKKIEQWYLNNIKQTI